VSDRSHFRSRPSPRSEHPRKLADTLPQLTPAFQGPVERCLFLFDVSETCTLHLLGSSVKAFGAYGIHRKEAECLCEWYTISSCMQKFNVRIHSPKYRTQSHFAERSFGNRTFNKQSRSPSHREALNDTNELLAIGCKDCPFLVGDADPRWSVVLARLVDLPRHASRITTGSKAVNVT
jgi:hypothetical protein